MRHVVRCVGLACLVAGMLSASVQAGPIFALRVVEKNGVNLRTCDSGVNAGLSCVAGRTRCVDGSQDGVECITDINCPGGLCEPDCPGFGVSCVGVTAIDAIGTDVIVLDATVRGFDDDLTHGRCFGDDENDPPCQSDSECTGGHCTNSGNPCGNDGECSGGAACVDNLCDPFPTVGTFQWTMDGTNSYTSGDRGSLLPYILEIGDLPCEGECIGGNNNGNPCTNFFDCFAGGGVCSENALNDVCRHGALFDAQCTCFFSNCDEAAGVCDLNATAYIQMSRKDYVHTGGATLVAVLKDGADWSWAGTLLDVNDPLIEDQGTHLYLGTLWLTSTDNACGTFTVDMVDNPNRTFLTRYDQEDLPGITFESVTIDFGTCIDDCGDLDCTGSETACTCPNDCRTPACGDGCCSRNETPCTCPQECADECGDGCCSGDETACTCPNDCSDDCGDGCCTGTENGDNCPDDCGVECVNYVSSVPDASDVGEDAIRTEGTLWRTMNNVIRITLDGAADAAPNAGDVEIRELQDGGAFGPDLSATFEFTMEAGDTVLRIKDTVVPNPPTILPTILHQKWYAIMNVGGWAGVCDFERHYASAYGDGSGDGLVQFADLAFINSMINQDPVSPDADRHDINGDNLIQFADLAAANATINLHAIPKPSGH